MPFVLGRNKTRMAVKLKCIHLIHIGRENSIKVCKEIEKILQPSNDAKIVIKPLFAVPIVAVPLAEWKSIHIFHLCN